MNGESRLPLTLVAAIVTVVIAVGLAAYFAGRFGRSSRTSTVANAELPEALAPVPAMADAIEAPAEIPPTVTPSVPVVIEKTTRSRVLVERSSQIVVPVPPAPTARPASAPIEPGQLAHARNRIVIEARPTPTPTVPELEQSGEPTLVETPVPDPPEPPEEEPPEPEPTARPRNQVALRPISEAESSRDLSNRDLSRRSSRANRGGADRPIGC